MTLWTWLPLCPDLNVIENVWRWLPRKIYGAARQFLKKNQLEEAWDEMPSKYIPSFNNSLLNRMIEVVSKNYIHYSLKFRSMILLFYFAALSGMETSHIHVISIVANQV